MLCDPHPCPAIIANLSELVRRYAISFSTTSNTPGGTRRLNGFSAPTAYGCAARHWPSSGQNPAEDDVAIDHLGMVVTPSVGETHVGEQVFLDQQDDLSW